MKKRNLSECTSKDSGEDCVNVMDKEGITVGSGKMVKDGEPIYVIRCTCDNRPTNDDYMLVDGAHPWNNPPCTGQGFVGDEENLIPEYTYTYPEALKGKPITNGAIFKIDADGNEYLAAYWNSKDKVFESV